MADDTQKLHYAILEYIKALSEKPGAAEGLAVALECLQTAFGLQLGPENQQKLSVGADLLTIFKSGVSQVRSTNASSSMELDPESQEKFKLYLDLVAKRGYFDGVEKGTPEYEEKVQKAKQRWLQRMGGASAAASTPATAAPQTDKYAHLTPEQRAEQAEQKKAEGNSKLLNKLYNEAVECYTEAINLSPNNAIYYSNRAAAWTHLSQHEKAIEDCKMAIKIDPKYTKAYSRLGLAYYSLGKYKEAIEEGYKKVLELEPNNTAAKEALQQAEAKLKDAETKPSASASASASASSSASSGAGASGIPNFNPSNMQAAFNAFQQMMGGGGGLPDMGALFNNPQFNAFAQQMMSNPQFLNMAQSLASNPNFMQGVAQLMNMFGGQGSNPSSNDS